MFLTFILISLALGTLSYTSNQKPFKRQVSSSLCDFRQIERPCDPQERYRRLDGSCNNLNFSFIGKAGAPYTRLLPSRYSDNISKIRSFANDGKQLPNARLISMRLSNNRRESIDSLWTNMMPIFGQFLAHDVAKSVSDISNCDCNNITESCISVPVPLEDTRNNDQECIVMARSESIDAGTCGFDQKEQINQMTSSIDLSPVYGLNQQELSEIRLFARGLLRVTVFENAKEYMPLLPQGTCRNDHLGAFCFKSPDERVNQNLGLTSLHTVFIREHNRLAFGLSLVNPHWDDERLFQEARRINIAQLQHITYDEYLPIIIGFDLCNEHNLLPLSSGYSTDYAPNLRLGIFNEFSTAAFRLHTLVRSFYRRVRGTQITGNLSLSDITFNAVQAWNFPSGGLDGILTGAANERMMSFDNLITDMMKERLFESNPGTPHTKRFDISTLNINRGRDHGIMPYNAYLFWQDRVSRTSFDQLTNVSPANRKLLSEIYDHVSDIDLYVGGISEEPVTSSQVVGPTFALIIARQFRNLKRGDRFFYESNASPLPFTPRQLDNIRQIKLARLLCDNLNNTRQLQVDTVFTGHDIRGNARVNCSQFARLDLNLWRENL